MVTKEDYVKTPFAPSCSNEAWNSFYKWWLGTDLETDQLNLESMDFL